MDRRKGQKGRTPSTVIIQGRREKFNRIFTFFRRKNQKNAAQNRSTFGNMHNKTGKKTNKESEKFAPLVEN